MLNIALIVPKGSKYGKNIYLKDFLFKNNIVNNFYSSWETPNLSLLTIAAYTPDSANVVFIDEDHGQKIDFECSYDIVALTAMTQQANRAYEIADEFRKRGVYVAMGGIHATILPEEALTHVDTVFIGEGEVTWCEFLADFIYMKPKKKYMSKEFVDMLDMRVPRYDLVDANLYNSFSIQITRGCPRTCSYCTLPIMYGNTYRHKTVEQVVREIECIQSVTRDAFIFFADDNMFIDRAFIKNLLQRLCKMDIKWGTQTDISVANDSELLELIARAGCHWLFIGFENVTQRGLRFLDSRAWKASYLEKYESAIEKIHGYGIQIWGSFMFGGDNDNLNTFDETLSFALRNGLYSGSFTILTPLPGTELYRKYVREDRITDYDWSRYTFWDVIFRPQNMTEEELARGVAYVYEQFYSGENIKRRTVMIRKRMRNSIKVVNNG